MCGITGWWNRNQNIDRDLFNSMRDSLSHRGPDGFGSYFCDSEKIALGHRRLSFLDLSESGAQPICNENKTIWLTANGEIYNYLELREQLKDKHQFKSGTDSEVIIHAYEEWGMEMINKLEGMFAFALWDEKKQKLFLARDRFGIKPLYYYLDDNQIIFASEIKAIIKNPDIPRDIDNSSFCDFFVYRYIPSPKTIFKNIYKVEPAYYIEIDNASFINKTEYFKFSFDNNIHPQKKVVAELNEMLKRSVEIHTRSDVPVGSLLSGGYDSSAMVRFFTDFQKGFNTFSIGFSDWESSEHQFAEIIAKKFKTNHYSEVLDKTSLDILKDLVYFYDEPIADISIIPTYQVSKLAAAYNKAVLSGEGADEIFAGYTWHRDYLWHISKKDIRSAKKWGWDLPVNSFDVQSYAKAMGMGEFDKDELSKLLNPEIHKNIPEDTNWFYRKFYREDLPNPKQFQYMDIKCFMGELVLTKVDRASMANSLEVRVPFLNSGIVSKMLNLSPNIYFDKSKQKILLYKLLKNKLPSKILKRKKQGFVGPDKYYMDFEWYKNTLKNSLLVENNIINRECIDNYLNNKEHWKLWKISVMELWYKKWIANE